jgi:anthranilate phosphoribosyltransferase
VHGSDGLDELTTTAESHVVSLENGTITRSTVAPEDIGLRRVNAEALKGGDGVHNAKALRAVLEGEKTAYRDIAILNAAASLMVAGRASSLPEGAALAATSIDSGAARARLDKLIEISNG